MSDQKVVMLELPIFQTRREVSYELSVGKTGKCSLTKDGQEKLGLEVGDYAIQTGVGSTKYLGVRPNGVSGGFLVAAKQKGLEGVTFGTKSLKKIYTAGKFNLGETVQSAYTNDKGESVTVTWYKLEPVE